MGGAPQNSQSNSVSPELLDRLKKMDETMKKLADVLEDVAESTSASRGDLPPLVMPTKSIDPAILENLTEHSDLDNDLSHFKWTYQQVLDVYGKPTRSNPSPGGKGHKFYYELPNGGEVIFWFIDDHVVRAMAMTP